MTPFSQGSSARPLSDCHALLSRCSLQAGCYVTSVQGTLRESKRIRERKNPEGNQDQNVFLRRKKKRRKDWLFVSCFPRLLCLSDKLWLLTYKALWLTHVSVSDYLICKMECAAPSDPCQGSCHPGPPVRLWHETLPPLSHGGRKGLRPSYHFLHLLLLLPHRPVRLSVLLRGSYAPSDFPLTTPRWSWLSVRVPYGQVPSFNGHSGDPYSTIPPFPSPGCQVLGLNVTHHVFGSHYQHGADMKEGGMGWVLLSLPPPAFLSSLFYRTPALEPQGEAFWQIK